VPTGPLRQPRLRQQQVSLDRLTQRMSPQLLQQRRRLLEAIRTFETQHQLDQRSGLRRGIRQRAIEGLTGTVEVAEHHQHVADLRHLFGREARELLPARERRDTHLLVERLGTAAAL
jgi:hypothetical protein